MTLKEYRRKRDFSRTPEPKGALEPDRKGNRYLIQKHQASHLHYDFRLEMGGVLKSWAVPKGPSLNPGERRLAVEVEDHPIEYATFEGTIPEDEYGGGTVMLWDQGAWEAVGDALRGLRSGRLTFILHGEKLKGRWLLLRISDEDEERKNWLLIKKGDEYSSETVDVLEEQAQSVVSGRTLEEIRDAPDAVWKNGRAQSTTPKPIEPPPAPSDPALDPSDLTGAKAAPMPESLDPKPALLVRQIPEGKEWLHEIKFDGYRFLAFVEGRNIRLITRRGNDWTDRFPTMAEAISKLPAVNAIFDGELVVLDPDGTPNFQALQNALTGPPPETLFVYLFDLPYYEGFDLRETPLIERKNLLERVIQKAENDQKLPLRYSDHIIGKGTAMFQHACRFALEGTVSKQVNSLYDSARNEEWVKTKCIQRQEFVIGGYTDPEGSREGFGALLLGYYDEKNRLAYAGRVGTGFDKERLDTILSRLIPLEQEESSFYRIPPAARLKGVHYVEPKLVAEVEFSNWTADGILRQASFKGLREDKDPHEIHRERPKRLNGKEETSASPKLGKGKESLKMAAQTKKLSKGASPVEIAGVTLTNPEKILYPEQGVTKQALAEYYHQIADWILPYVTGRPISVIRCPSGRAKKCFFQRHYDDSLPEPVLSINVEEKEGDNEPYILIQNLPGLISLVQMGALEIHPWGSRADKLERPDWLVFDLDPDEGMDWQRVIEGAVVVRDRLKDLGLQSFVKTSGGKGLHVVVPIARRSDWEEVSQFSGAVAKDIVQQHKDDYVATMSKAARKGKIFIDHFRNTRGASSVAAYSTRAKPGAPISTPISWHELDSITSAQQFTLENIRERLKSLKSDPWEGFFKINQSITKEMKKELGL